MTIFILYLVIIIIFNLEAIQSFNPAQNIILDENNFIIEGILKHFIKNFNEINISNNINTPNSQKIEIIKNVINFLENSQNKKLKKKNKFSKENLLKLEEKEFLYRTYLSSSDQTKTNQPPHKYFLDETFRITQINTQIIRGLLILIKEELL